MDKPIIFSAPMVLALLAGRKTQTRRVLKHKDIDISVAPTARAEAGWFAFDHPKGGPLTCVRQRYAVGDRLWVKEGWTVDDDGRDWYRASRLLPPLIGISATSYGVGGKTLARWRSPIHMPRRASRLTLTVTDVRVQRVQEISEADAIAEGIERVWNTDRYLCGEDEGGPITCRSPVTAFANLWNSIHGPDAWQENPWVAAYSFTVEHRNIDA